LTLHDTRVFAGQTAGDCLRRAAALERHSEHPIAHALRAAAGPATQAASVVTNTPGAGLSGELNGQPYFAGTAEFVEAAAGLEIPAARRTALQADGHTLVWLADSHQLLAVFQLGDELRAGARTLIEALQHQGKHVLLLTGDHAAAARHVANAVGITEVEAGLRPQDKLTRVQQLAATGAVVAMIGDGINDAAALAGAHVSVAMGGGTQLAAAAADLLLLSEHLPQLAEGVALARKTLAIIRQNMAWAIGYNLVALPFAAMGLIAPWMAALGMSASSLLVVANALRLRDKTARATLSRQTPA
jgi:Cu2+-exporting ATPase